MRLETPPQQVAPQNREPGLDLLRCVSMFWVVCLHLLNYGSLYSVYENNVLGRCLLEIATVLAFPCVDVFVLLSGYLLSTKRFDLSRIIHTWSIAVFWSVAIQCIFFILDPASFSLGSAVYSFLPLSSGRYWFLNAYFVMFLMIPALNHLIRTLPHAKLFALLLAVVILTAVFSIPAQTSDVFKFQNGYHFAWFLALYLIGGYVRKYLCTSNRKKNLMAYLLFTILQITFVIVNELLSDRFPIIRQYRNYFIAYTSPFVYMESICLLQLFRDIRFRQCALFAKISAFLSPLTFSVYLIHEHPLIRENLIKGCFSDLQSLHPIAAVILIPTIAFIIFCSCIFLDWVRRKLFTLLQFDKFIWHFSRNLVFTFKHLIKQLT